MSAPMSEHAVVIVGGTQGLGRDLARHYVEAGRKVVITGRDADRPVGARRDDPVDVAGPGQPVDRLLVLRRDDRALVREGEAGRLRVAVDRNHLDVRPAAGRLEQPELGGTCA